MRQPPGGGFASAGTALIVIDIEGGAGNACTMLLSGAGMVAEGGGTAD